MVGLRSPAALLAALALLGCGGGHSSGSTAGRAPSEATPAAGPAPRAPLCTRLRADVTGHVGTGAATELSGLALSRSQPGVLWTHNDSGDRARVFAVAPDGRVLAEVAVKGAESVDWEDIAIGPAPGGGDALYLGDIGDNLANRSSIVVYRVPEPRLGGVAPSATAAARGLRLRYPDGPHDAEALLVDPADGALVIVSKEFAGPARLYVARNPSSIATTTLRPAGEVPLGGGRPVTAGDVSADGRTLVLRTYDRAFVWSRHRGESLASALRRRPCAAGANLLAEGQGEALGLASGGRAFYTVPEGDHPALRRYAPAG